MADRDALPGRPGPGHGRRGRRPAPAVVAATAALALLLATACSAGGGSPADDAPAGADGRAGSATTAPPTSGPPFAVGRRSLELVDTTRGTRAAPSAGLPAELRRRIAVELIYPAAPEPRAVDRPAGGDGPATTGAVPTGPATTDPAARPDAAPAEGRFPLVVFAHGLHASGERFVPLAVPWARAGYVVALPTFPLSRGGVGDASDYQEQPRDVSFVIDEVVALGDDPSDPLAGRIDGERVAVGGHSLGSATALGVAYNSCCTDERIDAVISVSGGGLTFEGGDYNDPPPTPLLLVHGAADNVVPVSVGDTTFENMASPVHYLRFTDADHVSLFNGEDGDLLASAMLAFLDAHLRDEPEDLDRLPALVERSGRAALRTKA